MTEMTRDEAKKVLNQTREGVGTWTRDQIRDALTATGDLEPHEGLRGQALAQEVQRDQGRKWFYCGTRVVAEDIARH